MFLGGRAFVHSPFTQLAMSTVLQTGMHINNFTIAGKGTLAVWTRTRILETKVSSILLC